MSTAQEIIAEWGPLLIVARLREFLDDEQLSRVLTTLDSVCHVCWNENKGCQCWNDE